MQSCVSIFFTTEADLGLLQHPSVRLCTRLSEAHLGLFQTSVMEIFVKLGNGYKLLTIFTKKIITYI